MVRKLLYGNPRPAQDPISERWRACEDGGAILENFSSMAMLARELQEQVSIARATSWRKTELSESRNQMVGRFGTKLNFLSLCACLPETESFFSCQPRCHADISVCRKIRKVKNRAKKTARNVLSYGKFDFAPKRFCFEVRGWRNDVMRA